jgi:hypothetical protein
MCYFCRVGAAAKPVVHKSCKENKGLEQMIRPFFYYKKSYPMNRFFLLLIISISFSCRNYYLPSPPKGGFKYVVERRFPDSLKQFDYFFNRSIQKGKIFEFREKIYNERHCEYFFTTKEGSRLDITKLINYQKVAARNPYDVCVISLKKIDLSMQADTLAIRQDSVFVIRKSKKYNYIFGVDEIFGR